MYKKFAMVVEWTDHTWSKHGIAVCDHMGFARHVAYPTNEWDRPHPVTIVYSETDRLEVHGWVLDTERFYLDGDKVCMREPCVCECEDEDEDEDE